MAAAATKAILMIETTTRAGSRGTEPRASHAGAICRWSRAQLYAEPMRGCNRCPGRRLAGSYTRVDARVPGTKDVGSAGGQKRIAGASSRTLSASKGAARITLAWNEFDFLPPELVSACGALVERYHAQQVQSCKWPVEIIWRSDADELLRHHRALKTLFDRACRTRRAKLANELQEHVAALILACETLVQDKAGWGARYPEARASAVELFANVSDSRPWLMETYGCPALQG